MRRSSGKAGLEVSASTSPLRGSMTTTEPGLAGHRPLRRFLDAAVDRGDDLGARVGLLAPHDLHRPAEGVHLDALAAVAAAQVLVEEPLEAATARSCRRGGSGRASSARR